MSILKAGTIYFALTFGAGFVLGTVRVLWVVPIFGTRAAELMETPIMFVAMLFAARWTVRRFGVPPVLSRRLGVGLVALSLMLAGEFGFVLRLRGLTVSEYFASRDPVSGTVYYIMLVVFAILPVLIARR